MRMGRGRGLACTSGFAAGVFFFFLSFLLRFLQTLEPSAKNTEPLSASFTPLPAPQPSSTPPRHHTAHYRSSTADSKRHPPDNLVGTTEQLMRLTTAVCVAELLSRGCVAFASYLSGLQLITHTHTSTHALYVQPYACIVISDLILNSHSKGESGIVQH